MGAGSSGEVKPVAVGGRRPSFEVSYPLPESTLPRTPRGQKMYHLALAREQLARNIILVGDPERVPALAERFLVNIEADADHRGLRSITGHTKDSGALLSFVTTGMGVGSTEIVMGELAALNELNISTRCQRDSAQRPLRIIRVGTCGALQTDVPLGTGVISAYSVGLDSLGLYYDAAPEDATVLQLEAASRKAIEAAARPGSRLASRIHPYAARASPKIVGAIRTAAKAMAFDNVQVGVTACAPGFFAPQGRVLLPALAPTVPDIDEVLSHVSVPTPADFAGDGIPHSLRIENMEMETSAVLHMASALGYEAAAICLTVAHRRKNTFLESGQQDLVLAMAAVAVRALEDLEKAEKGL